MSSPTQRTLALVRGLGMAAQVVERWNPHAKIRQDLFGCIDIVACGASVWGIQACAGSSASARVKKSMEQPGLVAWLRAGGRFVVQAWAKRGARGKPKLWTARCIEILLSQDRKSLEQREFVFDRESVVT
jgi:hypothetical protein